MIDTHAHIFDSKFHEDIDEVIDQSLAFGISKILMPNIDLGSIEQMIDLEERFPDTCYSMMGLHPCSVDEHFEKALYEVESWLDKRKFVAVGEMGTDLYWDNTYWKQQQEAFRVQSDLALKHDLPIVIHSRDSIDETIALVEPYVDKGLRGVFHCFTGSPEQATKIKEMGFFLGIGGVVTFKNSGLDKVLEEIGTDQIVLETDSPYLAPTPHRGKRNSPTFLPLIAQKIATIFDLSVAEVSTFTDANAQTLFRLDEL